MKETNGVPFTFQAAEKSNSNVRREIFPSINFRAVEYVT